MLQTQQLQTNDGYYEKTLHPAKTINHYHTFIYTVNLTKIIQNYNKLLTNLAVLTPRKGDTVLLQLHNQIRLQMLAIEDILYKFKPRVKRGLINGLGTIIKWIAGTPDANDVVTIQNNIKAVAQGSNAAIQQVNKVTAVLQTLTDKLSENQNILQKELSDLENHIFKLENEIQDTTLFQIDHFQTSNLLQFLQMLERTISFAWKNNPNLEMFSVNTIRSIHQYLSQNYDKTQIIPVDEHIYTLLEFSKNIVAQIDGMLIFLTKVPILSKTTGTLSEIIPIPNNNNIILVPNGRYYLKMENQHGWLDQPCPTAMNTSICTTTRDGCDISKRTRCITARVVNPWSNIVQFDTSEVLLDSSTPIDVIEDCDGHITRKTLTGTNSLKSECRLIINEILYDNANNYLEQNIPSVINYTFTPKFNVHLKQYHLHDYSLLQKELEEIHTPPLLLHNTSQLIHVSISVFLLILIIIVIILLYKYRLYIDRIRRRPVIKFLGRKEQVEIPLQENRKGYPSVGTEDVPT